MTKHTDFATILAEAHQAASDAQRNEVEQMNHFNCGFAWVTVDGRHPLVRWCRQQSSPKAVGTEFRMYGSKGYPKGWQWWCPGSFRGQDVDIHRKGAQAFADKLAEYGITATVDSRLD